MTVKMTIRADRRQRGERLRRATGRQDPSRSAKGPQDTVGRKWLTACRNVRRGFSAGGCIMAFHFSARSGAIGALLLAAGCMAGESSGGSPEIAAGSGSGGGSGAAATKLVSVTDLT